MGWSAGIREQHESLNASSLFSSYHIFPLFPLIRIFLIVLLFWLHSPLSLIFYLFYRVLLIPFLSSSYSFVFILLFPNSLSFYCVLLIQFSSVFLFSRTIFLIVLFVFILLFLNPSNPLSFLSSPH